MSVSAPSAVPAGALIGHQRPRICTVPVAVSAGSAEAAHEVCRLAGLRLDPWQEFALASSLAEREDGKWAAFEVGEMVSRQNGKGTTLEGRELTGLYVIEEERLIIHSAHEQATSSEHFRRLLELIESSPRLDEEVMRAPRGKGAEAIELRDGSRILFKTRTGGGARGLTGDLVVLDEAMILPEEMIGALVPTMAARSMHGNPQLWYTGSAVDQQIHEHGVVFARVRERGIAGAPRVMYLEWSIDADHPDEVGRETRESREAWAQANPGLGIRISEEHIANECAGALGPRTFAVERLGVGDWPRTDGESSVIDIDLWSSLTDGQSRPVGPLCICFDVTPDRSTAAIGVAGRREDGLSHVEVIDHRRGTSWVAGRLAELAERHDLAAILYQDKSPAASLVPEIEVEVTPVNTSELAQAFGVFTDAVADRSVRHLGTSELVAALRGASTRPLGDAFSWSRKSSSVDISPLMTVTIALWGVGTQSQAPDPWFEAIA